MGLITVGWVSFKMKPLKKKIRKELTPCRKGPSSHKAKTTKENNAFEKLNKILSIIKALYIIYEGCNIYKLYGRQRVTILLLLKRIILSHQQEKKEYLIEKYAKDTKRQITKEKQTNEFVSNFTSITQ